VIAAQGVSSVEPTSALSVFLFANHSWQAPKAEGNLPRQTGGKANTGHVVIEMSLVSRVQGLSSSQDGGGIVAGRKVHRTGRKRQ